MSKRPWCGEPNHHLWHLINCLGIIIIIIIFIIIIIIIGTIFCIWISMAEPIRLHCQRFVNGNRFDKHQQKSWHDVCYNIRFSLLPQLVINVGLVQMSACANLAIVTSWWRTSCYCEDVYCCISRHAIWCPVNMLYKCQIANENSSRCTSKQTRQNVDHWQYYSNHQPKCGLIWNESKRKAQASLC